MGTLRATRSYNNYPFILEANSLLLALVQFCKDIGIQRFTLEGDALRVVNGMQKHDADWSQGGSLIQDAKTLLNSFATWFVNHVIRDANIAAHID